MSCVSTPSVSQSCRDTSAPLSYTDVIPASEEGTTAKGAAGIEPGPLHSDRSSPASRSPTSLEEMIASTRHGLLLTCLWYIRPVDTETLLATGLTRDGVYLVEDGSVVGMVNNFRFNESPVDLLRRATQASSSQPTLCREWNGYFTWTSMPALRIPDFNMSTVSRAY